MGWWKDLNPDELVKCQLNDGFVKRSRGVAPDAPSIETILRVALPRSAGLMKNSSRESAEGKGLFPLPLAPCVFFIYHQYGWRQYGRYPHQG